VDRTLAGAFIDNGVRHRVFGVRLVPFCNWHKFLLLAARSPFLEKSEKLTLFDLREAVGICRLKWKNGQPVSKVRRPWLYPAIASLVFGWSTKRWLGYMERRRDDLLRYFGDYISRPEYTIARNEPAPTPDAPVPFPSKVPVPPPEVFTTVCDVIAFFHCGEETAWMMPMGRAYWYQLGYLRDKDEPVDFLDEDERAFQAEMKARYKELQAKWRELAETQEKERRSHGRAG
jgi:hypothetical protein